MRVVEELRLYQFNFFIKNKGVYFLERRHRDLSVNHSVFE